MADRKLTVHKKPKPQRGYTAQIRIEGDWVKNAGFLSGNRVNVAVRSGEILMTKQGA